MEHSPSSDPPSSSPPTCLSTPNLRSLWGFFLLNSSFATAQMIAAFVANSLSMISDSSSMLVDSVTYLGNIYAEHQRLQTGRDSRRTEIYASLFSVCALIVVTIAMFVNAAKRLADHNSETVDGNFVLGFSLGNLAIDLMMGLNLLYQQRQSAMHFDASYRAKEINLVSAIVHVLADTLRTLTGIVAGSIEINSLSSETVDAIASIIICVLIVLGAGFVLHEAVTQLKTFNAQQGTELLHAHDARGIQA